MCGNPGLPACLKGIAMTDKTDYTGKDLLDVARKVLRMESDAIANLLDHLDDTFLEAVELIYDCPGRVIVTGLGKSGAIGRKIAATLASTGTASYFLHAADGVHGDLGVVNRGDVIICISKSGNSPELFDLLPVLKRLDVPIISITARPDSDLARHSQVVLNIGKIKEACPHDLAPTTSTTASLAIGDALAIALLEKRGFTEQDFAFLHPGGALGKRLLLQVRDIMEDGEKVPIVAADATMKEAIMEIASKRGICVVANAERKVLGVVTNGDFNRLVERTEHFFAIPVEEVMNAKPKLIRDGAMAYQAYREMEQFRIIAMPVIDDDDKLVGVIHLHDIMRAGIT